MHRRLIYKGAPGGPSPVDRPLFDAHGYRAVMGAEAKIVAILQKHDGVVRLAKLAGTLDNGLEHRPHIGRRGSNHAEDVAASGLVSQCFGEVARLRLHLVEQLNVLDYD